MGSTITGGTNLSFFILSKEVFQLFFSGQLFGCKPKGGLGRVQDHLALLGPLKLLTVLKLQSDRVSGRQAHRPHYHSGSFDQVETLLYGLLIDLNPSSNIVFAHPGLDLCHGLGQHLLHCLSRSSSISPLDRVGLIGKAPTGDTLLLKLVHKFQFFNLVGQQAGKIRLDCNPMLCKVENLISKKNTSMIFRW